MLIRPISIGNGKHNEDTNGVKEPPHNGDASMVGVDGAGLQRFRPGYPATFTVNTGGAGLFSSLRRLSIDLCGVVFQESTYSTSQY